MTTTIDFLSSPIPYGTLLVTGLVLIVFILIRKRKKLYDPGNVPTSKTITTSNQIPQARVSYLLVGLIAFMFLGINLLFISSASNTNQAVAYQDRIALKHLTITLIISIVLTLFFYQYCKKKGAASRLTALLGIVIFLAPLLIVFVLNKNL